VSDNALRDQEFSTAPKPYVFVLMPFHEDFSDIYKYGIRGAAEDIGAYAERVDDQIFETGILDRIYNQINKADVIVADLTGRNANVFYEVGYAHALGKIVLLLTQSADDIPFDLKHHQHTVYKGKIEDLRTQLVPRLRWAINESKRRERGLLSESIVVSCQGKILPEMSSPLSDPINLRLETQLDHTTALTFTVRNGSTQPTQAVEYLYLLAKEDSAILPCTQVVHGPDNYTFRRHSFGRRLDSGDADFPFQYRLDQQIGVLPPGAVEELQVFFSAKDYDQRRAPFLSLRPIPSDQDSVPDTITVRSEFRLRLHGTLRVHEFEFGVEMEERLPSGRSPIRMTQRDDNAV
jgi:hypothetical protein